MDWPTAWSALVPVYALAAILHAIVPLFAALVWIIFVWYGLKVLDGARLAEDPWRGRGSPRPYLWTFALVLLFHLVSSATALGSGDVRSRITALATLPVVLGLAAWFVARTAPPGVREEGGWLRTAVGSELVGSLIPPLYLFGGLPADGDLPRVAALAFPGLTVVSVASFFLASRRSKRHEPAVARKVPRE